MGMYHIHNRNVGFVTLQRLECDLPKAFNQKYVPLNFYD